MGSGIEYTCVVLEVKRSNPILQLLIATRWNVQPGIVSEHVLDNPSEDSVLTPVPLHVDSCLSIVDHNVPHGKPR